MLNVLLCGVGGQGTVLLSRLIGASAIETGLSVRGTETIGMAQRGGGVVSHVRMGQEIHSPLIRKGEAGLIIAFEPGEAVRALPFLRPDGFMVVSDRGIAPVTSSLTGEGYSPESMIAYLRRRVKNLLVLDGEALIERCGSAKVMNVALLGAVLQSEILPFGEESVKQVMLARLPEKFHALNQKALEVGREMAKEITGKGSAK